MDKSNSNEESKDDFVDGRNVKTIRSLRRNSAKKATQSSKNIRESTGQSKDKRKDVKITKKKTSNNSRLIVGFKNQKFSEIIFPLINFFCEFKNF